MESASQPDLGALFARIVHNSLRPITLFLGLYYTALVLAHPHFGPGGHLLAMSVVAGCTAVALFAVYAAVRSGQLPLSRSHQAETLVGGLVLANSLMHLHWERELYQTTNVALTIVGSGVLFHSARWLAVLVGAAIAGWWGVTRSMQSDAEWTHYAFMLATSTVLAAIAHVVRIRALRELQSTRLLLHETELRKKAEQEQRRIQQRLLEADKLKSLGVLAGGVAHDVNNFLVAILGNAEMGLRELPQGSPTRGRLEQIMVAAERASELPRQMLDYAGSGRAEFEALNFSAVVEEMTVLLSASIPRDVVIERKIPPEPKSVEGDASQLRQVVMNLVTNAAEALEKRGGTISLEVGEMEPEPDYFPNADWRPVRQARRFVFLRVADDGVGMDVETRKKIFDPFFSTKFSGRGLGMAAVLGIVRRHQGAIKIDSGPGSGTTVTVLFPALEETAAPPPPVREGAGASWQAQGTVLVADDDAMVRDLVQTVLESAGFEVISAQDGDESLTRFRERADEVRLAIVDLPMPGKGGEETLAALRKVRADLPAILTSGYSAEQREERAAHRGREVFLEKPFKPQELLDAVRRALSDGGP